MKSIRFTKMHGAGNDYIYINGINGCPANLPELSRKMSDRHKGIGADGLILILPSDKADFRMRMFNADGSEGEMCGNASRCIAKYVYEKHLTTKNTITLETLAGIKILMLNIEDESIKDITVDMGAPVMENDKIPIASETDIIDYPLSVRSSKVAITAISMGNPHGVVFVKDLKRVDVHGWGAELEINPIFPQKANIEFAQIITPQEINMRVWERGSGETMACGTGACATVVAGVITGRCEREVTVHLLGGDLHIRWDDQNNHVYMTGEAETVFEGEYKIK